MLLKQRGLFTSNLAASCINEDLMCFRVLEQLGGKQSVMHHLTHPDPSVRYEALLAVQKLMVHNW